MTIEHDLVIGVGELRAVTVACAHCPARLTLDLATTSAHQERHGFFVPRVCPACEQPYDSALASGLDVLRRAYLALAPVQDQITFRTRSE
jgi:hypothetical protein